MNRIYLGSYPRLLNMVVAVVVAVDEAVSLGFKINYPRLVTLDLLNLPYPYLLFCCLWFVISPHYYDKKVRNVVVQFSFHD
jgi:hypothetical protein